MEATARASQTWIARRLLVLAGAVALGLLLQQLLSARLAEIVAHAEHDRVAARAELATWLRIVITGACGLTAALGLAILLACRNPNAAERFPPPGLLSLGARRVITGPRARTMTRLGFALGLSLFVASLAGMALGWYIAAVLLACRA